MREEDRLASVLLDIQCRRESGESVNLEEILEQNADIQEELRACLSAWSALDASLAPYSTGGTHEELRSLDRARYQDFKKVGEGGMGIVYLAVDSDLNREVAFKIVRPPDRDLQETPPSPYELLPPGKDTPASRAFETLKNRFLQEAWVTGGLTHPGIVPVYELGQTPEGVPYYTMRFVKGERTLKTAIENATDLESRLALLEPFLKVCDAIHYAHSKGLIHRDLKPANIALGEFGEAVVLDWGLAKMLEEEDLEQNLWQQKVKDNREAKDLKTHADAIGTPGYMAPEAAFDRIAEMDERSDVYSLGAILFEILTGRLPFEFRSLTELMRKLSEEAVPAPAGLDTSIPARLSELCSTALGTEPEARFSSAGELAAVLRSWQRESAVDREVETLLGEARATLVAAERLDGERSLRQLERVAGWLERIAELRPAHPQALAEREALEGARSRALNEREVQTRRKVLKSAAIVFLAAVALVAGIAALLVEGERRDVDAARGQAVDALERSRLMGLVNASKAVQEEAPMLSLLLAREAARESDEAPVIMRLHEAVFSSLERTDFGGTGAEVASTSGAGAEVRYLTVHSDGHPKIWNRDGRMLFELVEAGLNAPNAEFSSSGDRILVQCGDGVARLLDSRGRLLRELTGHKGLRKAVFSGPDGRILTLDGVSVRTWERDGGCTATDLDGHEPLLLDPDRFRGGGFWIHRVWDRPVRFFDMSGRRRFDLPRLARQPAQLWFSPSGDRILVECGDALDLLDSSGGRLRDLTREGRETTHAQFSPDGDRLLIGFDDGTVEVWDLRAERRVELRDFGATLREVVFLPDGDRILTLNDRCDGGVARLWGPGGEPLEALDGGQGYFLSAELSPPGNSLLTLKAVGPRDGLVELRDLAGRRITEFVDGSRHGVLWTRFSGDGRKVLTIDAMGSAHVWDLDGSKRSQVGGTERFMEGARFTGASTQLLARCPGNETTRVLFDLDSREEGVYRDPEHRIVDVVCLPSGDGILTLGEITRLWDAIGKSTELHRAESEWLHEFPVACTSNRILLATGDEARLFDHHGAELARLKGHTEWINSVALSQKHQRVVTGSVDGSARIWNLQGEEIALLREPVDSRQTGMLRVELSPVGAWVATLPDHGKHCTLWSLDGRRIKRLEVERGSIASVRACPTADEMLVGLRGGELAGLDRQGREVFRVKGHSGAIHSMEFSADGEVFVTASADGTARLWSRAGRELAVCRGHVDAVLTARISPDMNRILTTSRDRTTRLWDFQGTPLAVFRSRDTHPPAADISPDGRRVFVRMDARTVNSWLVYPEDLRRLADERITRDFTDVERGMYAPLLEAR